VIFRIKPEVGIRSLTWIKKMGVAAGATDLGIRSPDADSGPRFRLVPSQVSGIRPDIDTAPTASRAAEPVLHIAVARLSRQTLLRLAGAIRDAIGYCDVQPLAYWRKTSR